MTNKIVSDSVILDTDSEDELPAGWEERVTLDGKVYYARWGFRVDTSAFAKSDNVLKPIQICER